MKKLLTLSLLSCAATSYAALDYAIVGSQNQLIGTTAEVAGGSPNNFGTGLNLASIGNFAIFDVSDGSGFNGQLRITYADDLGTDSVGSNIMIARTVNTNTLVPPQTLGGSQNLTDTGTFTVLINQSARGLDKGVRLQLDWFQAGTYTGLTENFVPSTRTISPIVNFTTFDIDFQQYVRVQKSALSAYQLNSTTELAITDNGTTIQFNDPAPNADTSVTNPTTAAEFTTVAASSYYIEMGSNAAGSGYSLFMFEMRDPSSNVTVDGPPVVVPEPATFAGLLGLFSFAAVGRRRRVKA